MLEMFYLKTNVLLFSEKLSVICVTSYGLSTQHRGDYCNDTKHKRQEEEKNRMMNNVTCFLRYIQLRDYIKESEIGWARNKHFIC
jgi:hypothetical protein